jgi:hypothetical protein
MPGWLTSAAIKAFFSALLGFVSDWISRKERDKLVEEKAQAEAERDQAKEGERVNEAMAEEAAKRVQEEEALKKLEQGDA